MRGYIVAASFDLFLRDLLRALYSSRLGAFFEPKPIFRIFAKANFSNLKADLSADLRDDEISASKRSDT